MQTPDRSPGVYQLRVVVQSISPLVWRRLLVRSDMSLAALHDVLQSVFTWSDVHLHGFRIHGKEYDSTRLGGPTLISIRAICCSQRCACIVESASVTSTI
jgi:Plasmid pRiA4b ORF-3-like protein